MTPVLAGFIACHFGGLIATMAYLLHRDGLRWSRRH